MDSFLFIHLKQPITHSMDLEFSGCRGLLCVFFSLLPAQLTKTQHCCSLPGWWGPPVPPLLVWEECMVVPRVLNLWSFPGPRPPAPGLGLCFCPLFFLTLPHSLPHLHSPALFLLRNPCHSRLLTRVSVLGALLIFYLRSFIRFYICPACFV